MSYVPPFPSRHELLTLAFLTHARERGVHEMSVRSLSAAVRAAPGSLTYHYGNKDEALATCARFLGIWLHRDVQERLSDGDLARLLPDRNAQHVHDEAEYTVRLRAWIQLSAYVLSSPVLAPVVRAGDARISSLLVREDEIGELPAAAGLARWGAMAALAAAVLAPEAVVVRDDAVAAMASVGFSSDVRGNVKGTPRRLS